MKVKLLSPINKIYFLAIYVIYFIEKKNVTHTKIKEEMALSFGD